MYSSFLVIATVQIFAWIAQGAWIPHPNQLEPRAQQQLIACQILQGLFPDKVFRSNSSTYLSENNAFYSSSAVLSPGCVFVPSSPRDISIAVPVLSGLQTQFAVRGGGHMPIAGAANTRGDGILIGLNKLVSVSVTTFNRTEVAVVESGNRWGPVYSYLAARGLTVSGGRYWPVGVGGQPLGGGISYYNSARGWTVNDILQYEVVTANGRILLVNSEDYSDLFWALKGGSNNFGIVTKYYMRTFPLQRIYAGFIGNAEKDNNQLVEAIATYCDPKTGGSLDPKAALDANLFYSSSDGSTVGLSSIFYNGTGPTPALKNFTDMPLTSNTVANRDFLNWLDETRPFGDGTQRKLWSALSLKSTPDAVRLAGQVFTDAIRVNNASLRNVDGGSFTVTWQPITQEAVALSRRKGGDAIDLDPADGPVMLMLYASSYTGAQHDLFVNNFLKNITYTLEAKSKQAGLYYPYVFLNDAGDFQQDIISLYGNGKSLPKMKQIAIKYDPQQVFQRLLKGAFKLGPRGNL